MPATTGATIVSSFTETVYTTILEDSILRELRPAMFMRPHFRMGRAGDSLSFDFLLLDDFAPTNIETSKTETEAFTNVEVTTGNARVTAALAGTMASVGDIVKTVSNQDVLAEVSGTLARAYAEKWETTATALLASFTGASQTITAAASKLSYDDLLAAIAYLEQADVTAPLVGGFHPKQLADLRSDIAGRTGEVFGKAGNDLQSHYRDAWGSLVGVPLYASTTVSSSGGNYQGAVFASGEALGYLEIWGLKTELWRDGKSLQTYVIVNGCYGMGEVSDARGVTVLSTTS